jgi:exodeoxyribonuclease-1
LNYIFYDTETTGLSAPFDQIVQFAAILTDHDLNEIDRIETRCRLRPHIVPSQKSMEITGVGIETLTDPHLPTAYDLARDLADLFAKWGPAVFIGHNSIGFDEGFLRQLFYQSLLPAYVTSMAGNSRADTLLMVKAFAAVHPTSFVLPLNEKGSPVFKLEGLAIVNGFGEFKAHDALADVEATVFLAKIMRAIDPQMFDHLVDMGNRSSASQVTLNRVPFLMPTTLNGETLLTPMAGIIECPVQHARIVAIDLEVPIEHVRLVDFHAHAILDRFKHNGRPIFRKVATNRQPTIIPVGMISGYPVNPDWSEKIDMLRSDSEILERLNDFLVRTAVTYNKSEYVEEQLYEGFPSRADSSLMAEFHRVDWSDRMPVVQAFDDDRFRQLGQRLVAENAPETLLPEVRSRYELWVNERRTAVNAPWNTIGD